MSEQFENMTVVELRNYAREHQIPLPAGINKQGIYALKSTTQAIVLLVKDGSPVDPNASVEEQARQAELNAQQEAAQELEKAEAREAARKEAAAKKAAAGKTENVTKTERIVVSK